MSIKGAERAVAPPSDYDETYYLTNCGGFLEFQATSGFVLPEHMSVSFAVANVRPEEMVLDVGCGRGEILIQSALCNAHPVGIDFSKDAVRIARRAVASVRPDVRKLVGVEVANAQALPFRTGTFDVAFWLDVIEHMGPPDVDRVLQEVRRVLRPGGRLIVHTSPNLWYFRYGYYVLRWLGPKARRMLPPRAEMAFAQARHVNEQSTHGLRRVLRQNGFRPLRVWLRTMLPYQPQHRLSRMAHWVLYSVYPLYLLFRTEVYAIAYKE